MANAKSKSHKLLSPGSSNMRLLAQEAVVIGGSIAGLTAARVLADYVAHLTIIDRDHVNDTSRYRQGVPQSRHAHTLPPHGQEIMERLFPGLLDEMAAQGAVLIDPGRENPYYEDGRWRMKKSRQTHLAISSSRPLLENIIYRRVASLPNVEVINGLEVVSLQADRSSMRVAGVNVRRRGAGSLQVETLPADLVLDASGRSSQAPHWLAELDLQPPEEWRINSFVGYATREYLKPEGFEADWKALYVLPTPPDSTRGGVIQPVEGNRWFVSLMGEEGDYPPTDVDGFMDFARSLPTPRIYEAIRDARPLSAPQGYRRTENRVRRYDQLPHYLEGFFVIGDAVFAMNPIFAMGMTAAADGALVLERSLQDWLDKPALDGMAKIFQKRLAKEVGRIWKMTVSKEWEWEKVTLEDNTEEIYPPSPTLALAA
jgi:2-polyprenyl-6-methoxyphenol hydroxylase-like FAD-dependent oxidoreductase